MEKNYDVLVKDQLFFGGAKDAEAAFTQESVDVVIDVRVQGLSLQEQETVPYYYKHMPIADEDSEVASSIQQVAQEVAIAFEDRAESICSLWKWGWTCRCCSYCYLNGVGNG